MKACVSAALMLIFCALSAAAQYGRPLGGGRMTGGGGAVCRVGTETGGECGAAPAVDELYVVPRALWAREADASSCDEPAKAAVWAGVEAAAAYFNGGIVRARLCGATYLAALAGNGCAQSASLWNGWVSQQRRAFLERWGPVVRAGFGSCPKTNRKPAGRGPSGRAAPACAAYDGSRQPGGCDPLPAARQDAGPWPQEMTDPSLPKCEARMAAQTNMLLNMRAQNHKFAVAACVAAADHFLAAQSGKRCGETADSHQAHLESQLAHFKAVWRAASASGCRP